jgi:hypothetical protein
MDKEALAVPAGDAELQELKDYKVQIELGKKNTGTALKSMAEALIEIRDRELFKLEGYSAFSNFVERELRLDRNFCNRLMDAGSAYMILEKAKVPNIPVDQTHLLLLHKIPSEKLARAFTLGVETLDKQDEPLKVSDIKQIVEGYQALMTKKVDPVINLDGNTQAAPKARSEAAEIAIERIGRLAGDVVLKAILKGTLKISDSALVTWAEESDQRVKNLAYYIMYEGMSLKEAIAYEDAILTVDTTLHALITLARARGGKYQGEMDSGTDTWEFSIKRSTK